MHELSIAQALIQEIDTILAKEHCQRCTAVTLDLGALCGVDAQALTFCWPLATRDTLCQDAALTLNAIPLTLTCPTCKQKFELEDPFLFCPECGSAEVQVITGQEMIIRRLEVQ
jgi:hydrogenase nickel incorporation protein HypA/HybF